MRKRSAGILLFRKPHDCVEVLLVHPGGPFWAKKDEGVWSIPKGEYGETEDAWSAAKRELWEETGIVVSGEPTELGTYKQPSGKLVSAWAIEGDFDPRNLKSNNCRIVWPPRSGRHMAEAVMESTAYAFADGHSLAPALATAPQTSALCQQGACQSQPRPGGKAFRIGLGNA
jgi:predicted NUDIX family NTP pyrophosphohydrolase